MDIRKLTVPEALDLAKGRRSLREILDVPEGFLALGAFHGHDAFVAGDLATARIVGEGLVAADRRYAYGHSLLAAVHLAEGSRGQARSSAEKALALAGSDEVLRAASLAVLAKTGATGEEVLQ